MGKSWIIVINREQAKIFVEHGEKIEFLQAIENPKGGQRKREFATDRPGLNRRNVLGSRSLHGMTGGKDPTTHLEGVFAERLAKALSKEFANNEVTHVTLTAEPKMAGYVKTAFEKVSKLPEIVWWQKDCGKLSNLQIEKLMKHDHASLHS
jgi:protein required for attachment to host cells